MTMTDTPAQTETIEARRQRAHTLYLDYYNQGERLTGAQLGNLCDRSERWGQERIREVLEAGTIAELIETPTAVEESAAAPIESAQEPAAVVHVGETFEAPAAAADDSIAAAAEEAAVLTGSADWPAPVPAELIETPTAIDEPAVAVSANPIEEPAAAIEAPAKPAAPVGETSKAPADKGAKLKRGVIRVWPVWLLMAPAAVAIWGGWVGLGEMAGFGKVNLLPGIAEVEINTAITLPIGMEVYAAYALYVWLSGYATGQALKFARNSAILSLVVGSAGQMAYHVMEAAHVEVAPWPVTAVVAVLPVAVLGMGAGLAHLVSAQQEK